MKDSREWAYDNLKGLLIFFVILGHLLEPGKRTALDEGLLRVIYSFHMPMFFYITGHFAKFRWKKFLFSFLCTYFIFQVVYILAARWILNSQEALQLRVPYWLLWYLLVMTYDYALLPLLDRCPKPWLLIPLSLGAALVIGFASSVGYDLSLSRFFVFFPFFLLGRYGPKPKKNIPLWGKLLLTGAVGLVCVLLFTTDFLSLRMFYGSFSYEALNYGPLERLAIYAIALLWIAFFCLVVRPLLNRRLPLLSALGRNTLPAFLLHGFLVRGLFRFFPYGADSFPVQLVLAVLILLLLSNPVAARLLPGPYLERLWDRVAGNHKKPKPDGD